MHPIRTEEATGTYAAPEGLEDVVGGLPFWRETTDGIPEIKSVWTLDEDEKEAIALGGNVLLGITGEPIPPVRLEVLSPIDVPSFGMDALTEDVLLAARDEFVADFGDQHDGGLVAPIALTLVFALAAILLGAGFLFGRLTA